jgi:hypothetical protein
LVQLVQISFIGSIGFIGGKAKRLKVKRLTRCAKAACCDKRQRGEQRGEKVKS